MRTQTLSHFFRKTSISFTSFPLRFEFLLSFVTSGISSETFFLRHLRTSSSKLKENPKYTSGIFLSKLFAYRTPLVVVCDEQESNSSFTLINRLFSISRRVTRLSRFIRDCFMAFTATLFSSIMFSFSSFSILHRLRACRKRVLSSFSRTNA